MNISFFLLRKTMKFSATFFFSPYKVVVVVLAVISILSCKKPDGVGLEVQPPEEKLSIITANDSSCISYTVPEDSLLSDEDNGALLNLLGSYVDPVFGKTTASFLTQFILSKNAPDFGTNALLDSVVLILDYQGFYGDVSPATGAQQIKVYELTSSIEKSKSYYTSFNPLPYIEETTFIADYTTVPNPVDTIPLRVPLNVSFGQRFFDPSNSSNLTDNAGLLSFFKGLYITTHNPFQNEGEGAILYFNLLNGASKIRFYFHNTNGPSTFDLIINNDCARINVFQHDYSLSPGIINQLTDPTLGQSKIYVQSMAGLKSKITFPSLEQWIDSMPIGINKAELEFSVLENSIDKYQPPSKLLLVALDENGKLMSTNAEFIGINYLIGEYNTVSQKYRFNIFRYIQQVLAEKKKHFGFYLISENPTLSASRVVIEGGKNIVLNLTYTKL